MKQKTLTQSVLIATLFASTSFVANAECTRLMGTIGASSQWGSGWIDLPLTNINANETLRLSIGGSASEVLVRILKENESPDSPTGILGQFTVPNPRVIEFRAGQDFNNVKQISVHGGVNPWGQFPLGGGNGPATIMKAEKCTE